MTPDELDAIRERQSLLPPKEGVVNDDFYFWAMRAADDRDDLLAYVDQLHTDETIADGNWPALTAHLRAVVTDLSHHGDMTPTAKRVLMDVLDGVE